MWHEIFKFELRYRLKRPETYLFFLFLLLVSIFAVDFVFQGVEIGLVKKNAPIIIAKSMGAFTGIFMILASMIMGMPVIRDDQHQITPLFYTTPIKKWDYLLGRYLGSFLVLFIVFLGIPFGMMIGEFLPWHLEAEMGPFQFAPYVNGFAILMFPTLFFGASLFFVTGALSRNLLVVYTQGIILFVLFLLTKAITNDYLKAVFDPFSLTTTTQLSKLWTVADKNTLLMPFNGVLLANKLFWITMGFGALSIGYWKFNFAIKVKTKNTKRFKLIHDTSNKRGVSNLMIELPKVSPQYGWRAQLKQWLYMSSFYCKSLLKETSFWAIVICAVIIIVVNSISLGTVYEVDSYPTTYFIIAELQEMSIYFFVIILLFYSGELYWSERSTRLDQIHDVTPVSTFVNMSSKVMGLIGVYIVLVLGLIIAGTLFQLGKGYYHFDLQVYFIGFFVEILPFLVLYTFAAFLIQVLVNNKLLGILLTVIFFIGTISMQVLNPGGVLTNFAGGGLAPYSEMNRYGHFMIPYLWTKFYWLLFGILILRVAALFATRGVDTKFLKRTIIAKSNFLNSNKKFKSVILVSFLLVGGYLFYQTNVLNKVWSEDKELRYRAEYEKQLKQYEYLPQPMITNVDIQLELYPDQRSYNLAGSYTLHNQETTAISEIHLQQLIEDHVEVNNVQFSAPVSIDSQYRDYQYFIYKLEHPLSPDDSINIHFNQILTPQGWDMSGDIGSVLHNGTFIRTNEFPTLGYNKKYEIGDSIDRALFDLPARVDKAPIDDFNELRIARTGSDARGVTTNITIGTCNDQTAVTSGVLTRQWTEDNRNYFQYQTTEPIINFYAMLSGRYDVLKDQWTSGVHLQQQGRSVVDLEIYHHPRHNYNLERMMASMKASLDYYSTQFSPYQYQQLRIVEFPRYQEFAQSFPNTIPFSESIGFMLDIDDEEDVDMTYYVTAHEVAHQWWGMQVETANVQGRNFVLETLSQYSAIMVFKQAYPQDKVDQFLSLQQDLYEEGKQKAKVPEVPLYLVGAEDYIYYNKGAIVMYELQSLIGEEKVNQALRSFIADWNSKDGCLKNQTNRYATSKDLIGYLFEMTPEEDKEKVEQLLMRI